MAWEVLGRGLGNEPLVCAAQETYLRSGPVTATYQPGEIVEFQIAATRRSSFRCITEPR